MKKKRPLTLADLTDDERDRAAVAFHEAGHAVAATLLGGRIFAAVVGGGKVFGVAGHTAFDVLPAGQNSPITYAGPWAEARWRAGRRPTQRELFASLCKNSSDEEDLCRTDGMAAGRGVVPLLERCWPSVAKLAAQMWLRGEVRHEDCCAALGIPPEDNGHHLALIRSGSVPGTFTVTHGLNDLSA